MAEIFDFYVNDNRSTTFKLSEPIMLEDNGVSDWRFHIPNIVNGLDATGWAWWLVYVNARNDKYTVPLTLEYDYDRPDAYSIATYTVDYGMSCKVGNVRFSIEAIDADTGGTILHEWHTKTYSTNVVDTLQGNQVEYAETESDIISALLIDVRNRTNQLIGGATPTPVSAVSEMLDTDKIYLLTTDGEWYYYNGTAWVSGGVYGAGITDSVPTQGSTNAVSSGGVYSALAGIQDDIDDLKSGLQDIENDIEEIYIGKAIVVTETVNKLNPNEITSGVLVGIYGEETEDSRYWASGYIPLTTDKTSIAFTGTNANGTARVCLPLQRVLFYDANETVLEHVDSIPSNTITAIPTNAVLARINPRDTYYPRQPMVEFVDSIGEISSTFIAYEEVEERSHGINYLDETQQDILNRLDGVETALDDVSELPEQVDTNTEKINDIYGVSFPVSKLGTFVHGYIVSTNGEININQKYKVASPANLTAPVAYTMTIADGFRAYLYVFGDASIDLHKKWHTGTIEIEKGTVFRMTIARVTEDTSEVADIDVFCSKVTLISRYNLDYYSDEIAKVGAITLYGATWDWWISSNSVDEFGNAYIGYVDTNAYHGVLRRQPDGVMQYKRLERAENTDDHNGTATIVLDDGRILAIGAYGHSKNGHIVCWRSTKPYSIDVMEKYSFDIPQEDGGWKYACTYSQIFKYNGKLFDFLRCVSTKTGETTATGYLCLISEDNGETWTVYKAVYSGDPYISFAYASDDEKILKATYALNPATVNGTIRAFTFDMSTHKFYDMAGVEIGRLVLLDGGSMSDENIVHAEDMTFVRNQSTSTEKVRLLWTASAPKANPVFLYAVAVDSESNDFIYYLYDGTNSIAIGHSGTPFGNNHYISGACFGKDINTVYYSKATTSKADGAHELHKVKIANGAVESDEIITEASMCILRPLFLGNGELAVAVGHYNDQNDDGTYNRSFTAWKLKPLFTRA